MYRPSTLAGYSCHDDLRQRVETIISAYKITGILPRHILLTGGPGLGKTTLAKIIAEELHLHIILFQGTDLSQRKQLDSIFEFPESGGVIFIDEIHAVKKDLLEILYEVMEDGNLGISSKPQLKFKLPPVLLIGATTDAWQLPKPFLDRFGNVLKLRPMTAGMLAGVVRSAWDASFPGSSIRLATSGAEAIATVSFGTPRVAINYAYQLKEYAIAKGLREVSVQDVQVFLKSRGLDPVTGLDAGQRSALRLLINKVIGADSIAAQLGMSQDCYEVEVEPPLMYLKFLNRTPRGRELTLEGRIAISEMNKRLST